MAGGISGAGLSLATAGGVLLWSGLGDITPVQLLKDVSSGKQLPPIRVGSPLALLEKALGSAVSSLNPFSASAPASAAGLIASVSLGTSALGNAIASAALRYQGAPYKWAGATPAGWDCSGFVTYVLHHDLGLNLPSNTHTVTLQFLTWSGAVTIPVGQAQAGDLVCWPSHVAIAISPTSCIGAETVGVGTITGEFAKMGPGGETYTIRRVKAQSGQGLAA